MQYNRVKIFESEAGNIDFRFIDIVFKKDGSLYISSESFYGTDHYNHLVDMINIYLEPDGGMFDGSTITFVFSSNKILLKANIHAMTWAIERI